MHIEKGFFCYEDHFVYHITDKNNIESILKYGLIPSIGERSICAGDKNKAIYFFDCIDKIEKWMDFLYKNQDKASLEVLRFNIKRLKWYTHNEDEFYVKRKVPAKKIDYLQLYNDNRIITFSDLISDNLYSLDYRWIKLKEYYKNRSS